MRYFDNLAIAISGSAQHYSAKWKPPRLKNAQVQTLLCFFLTQEWQFYFDALPVIAPLEDFLIPLEVFGIMTLTRVFYSLGVERYLDDLPAIKRVQQILRHATAIMPR